METPDSIGSILKGIRTKLGFKSARAFYESLSSRADLGFNYSYYKRFENDEALPSVKVINTLAHLIPEVHGQQLVLAYCQSCFPQQKSLFETAKATVKSEPLPRPKGVYVNKGTILPQRVLTEREIALLAREEANYFVFMIALLSRVPVNVKEAIERLPNLDVEKALQQLVSAKLIYLSKEHGEEFLSPSYPEVSYPEAESQSLKNHYKKLDEYDAKRVKLFGFKNVISSEMFRRISPRYLELLKSQIEVFLQTARMSDDVEESQNTEIVSISLKITSGQMPG